MVSLGAFLSDKVLWYLLELLLVIKYYVSLGAVVGDKVLRYFLELLLVIKYFGTSWSCCW